MKRISTFFVAASSMVAVLHGCGSSDSGNTADGGAGSDSATFDSPVSHRDSAPVGDDAGGGDDSSPATGCPTPGDVSTWTPPALKPPKTPSQSCTAQEIMDYDTNCLAMGSSGSTCTPYMAAHKACSTCLQSKSTDPNWGPLVVFTGVININVSGCLALVEGATSTCAQAVQNYVLCIHTACDGVCPVNSQASFALWKQCETTALAQGCATYGNASNCVSTDDAGSICSVSGGIDAAFLSIAPLFCGGAQSGEGGTGEAGPTEAGPAEGGTDAPTGG
jgi:hypothetical protein